MVFVFYKERLLQSVEFWGFFARDRANLEGLMLAIASVENYTCLLRGSDEIPYFSYFSYFSVSEITLEEALNNCMDAVPTPSNFPELFKSRSRVFLDRLLRLVTIGELLEIFERKCRLFPMSIFCNKYSRRLTDRALSSVICGNTKG
ncbi:MAG: hypothetical protein SW833_08320 [Cyanobacteriota bacterium]|nr:hypothetical protein [Cyanobacteriota bacterium]